MNQGTGPARLRQMRLAPLVVVTLVTAGAALAAAAVGTPSSSHTVLLTFKLDHFLCYSIKSEGSATPTVTVRDQFDQTRKVTVVSPQWLCNWVIVKKERSHVRSSDHLLCYSTTSEGSFRTVRVKVTNRFKVVNLSVSKPNELCLPSGKSLKQAPAPLPTGFGHFQCYPVTPFASVASHTVDVRDEFGTARYSTRQPSRLCNPASKNLSAIVDPREHLLCYKIKPLTKPVTGKTVWITNQFTKRGPLPVKTLAPQLLCWPSLKSLLSSTRF